MGFLRVVTLSCCVLLTVLVSNRVEGAECYLEVVEDCTTNEEDRLVDVRNLTVGFLEGGKWAILGTAEINLPRITLTKIELTKCASKQEPETCTYFSTVKYKDTCKMLEAKGEMWSTFAQNAEPPLTCPMKGLYNFEKSAFDGDAAGRAMPGLEGFYWKTKTFTYVGKKVVSCLILEFSTSKS
uniref:Uncharacterized protein n=1 Tax=Lygus hesperus TaxID=30085 RepID=A0A0A9ZIL8_LYGHE